MDPLALLIVSTAAFAVALLTLFSGFGVGTLLMPVFALFFPAPVAVAATAVVHLLNNLFKCALLGRQADRSVVLRFGLPAVLAAFPGALLLARLAEQPALRAWHAADRTFEITPLKLVMGALILVFGIVDGAEFLKRSPTGGRGLAIGGALSGFLGGLSGHQGALRAVFLTPLGLPPPAFAATQAVIASMVDLSRLAVYGIVAWAGHAGLLGAGGMWPLVLAATTAAFLGSWQGGRLLKKVTHRSIRRITSTLLVLIGVLMIAGIV